MGAPLPLILAAWWDTPAASKYPPERAYSMGIRARCLDTVHQFLMGLKRRMATLRRVKPTRSNPTTTTIRIHGWATIVVLITNIVRYVKISDKRFGRFNQT